MTFQWNRITVLLLGVWLTGCTPSTLKVTVTNPTNMERNNEIVEIDIASLSKLPAVASKQFIITDTDGKQIPYQITYDNKVIFPADVTANGTSTYTIIQGIPDSIRTIACGKIYPERLDDVAWENDKAAYRAYGPALQANGERSFGYDVFTKRETKYPVVAERYALETSKELRAKIKEYIKAGQKEQADSLSLRISYHIDHGNGMDDYSVGPTLGCGTTALMNDTTIIYPWAYKTCKILDNGPLRFTMELTYNPLKLKNDSNIIETRLLSCDEGSYLNKTTVTYSNLSTPTQVAVGLVIHQQNPKEYFYNIQRGYIAYADSTEHPDRNQGVIFVGASFPQPMAAVGVQMYNEKERAEHANALGHVLGLTDYNPNDSFTYYWGSGWSKGDMPSMNNWVSYLENFTFKAQNPLKVEIK